MIRALVMRLLDERTRMMRRDDAYASFSPTEKHDGQLCARHLWVVPEGFGVGGHRDNSRGQPPCSTRPRKL